MPEERVLSRNQLKERIQKLLETSKSQSGHQNLVEVAKKIYNKQDNHEEFLNEFVDVLKFCLVYPDKAAADRMLLFVSKFAASLYSYKALIHDSNDPEEDMEHPFVNGLFEFLFQTHSAALVDVRLRCTTLINNILTALPDDSWLPVSIWTGLTEATRSRLQDKNTNVRAAAVLVARKLQEPKDPKCEIVKLLSFHMSDPAPVVRRAVISSIALSKVTIVDVLARTLDVNENVRRNAFAVIAKVRFQSLTISQRVTLLDRGLKDRAERVQTCVETVLISQWLDQINKNAITLMEGLDVVNCSDVVELMLDCLTRLLPLEDLIKTLPLDHESHLIPVEHLNPETALLWRFLAQHVSKNGMEDTLETLLPTLTAFTCLITNWYPVDQPKAQSLSSNEQWAEVKRKRVVIHLLELVTVFDLSDEMGRLNLRKMILAMLISPTTGTQLVDNLIELLYLAVPATDDFFGTLMEAISDIREPLNQVIVEQTKEEKLKLDIEISSYKVALNDLKEREYEAVQRKNYTEAVNLNAQIDETLKKLDELRVHPQVTLCDVREEKTDPETICKCLKILVKMLPTSAVKTLTPGLLSLREDFLPKYLSSDDLLTQSLAIQALAQFCILDKTLAQDHLLTFLFRLSENGDNEINHPALKAVFDILQTHGVRCFEKLDVAAASGPMSNKSSSTLGEDEVNFSQEIAAELSTPSSKCLAVLKELLNCVNNDELKRIAFEGFCKLLATGVIYSSSLLKTVIVKGFTPIRGNESEDRIRQLFMVFFPLFARTTARSQEMIQSAFIPVMRLLNDAPLGSPEADINTRDVATFLIDHTKPGINRFTSPTVHVHNTLAFSICHEILREISANAELGFDHNYLRGLLQLNTSFEGDNSVQEMLILLAKIKRETNDATCLRYLKQVQTKLMDSSRGAVSVQNTLQSTQQDASAASQAGESNESRKSVSSSRTTALFLTQKTSLDCVPETLEDLSIEDCSTSSGHIMDAATKVAVVVAESPEVSDASSSSDEEMASTPVRVRPKRRNKIHD